MFVILLKKMVLKYFLGSIDFDIDTFKLLPPTVGVSKVQPIFKPVRAAGKGMVVADLRSERDFKLFDNVKYQQTKLSVEQV